jgi:hypothetical protein
MALAACFWNCSIGVGITLVKAKGKIKKEDRVKASLTRRREDGCSLIVFIIVKRLELRYAASFYFA